MIIRIVKMTFRHEEVDHFLALFETVKDLIRNSQGCTGLALWRDTFHPNILFTYSLWEDENALNLYRNSELFKDTWAQTKIKFADKPEAWSVEQLVGIFNNKSE
jgi:quinol monooxygenase YgiN